MFYLLLIFIAQIAHSSYSPQKVHFEKTGEKVNSALTQINKLTYEFGKINPSHLDIALKNYRKAKKPKDRIHWSNLLNSYSKLLSLKPNKDLKLSKEERIILKNAQDLNKWMLTQVKNFESSLDDKDYRQISSGAAHSLVKFTKSLNFNKRPESCTDEEYQRLKKHISLENLMKYGRNLATLIRLYEIKNQDTYFKNLQTLISRKIKDTNLKNYLKAHYKVQQSFLTPSNTSKLALKKVLEHEERRIRQFVPQKNLKLHAYELVKKAPNCLKADSLSFNNQLKKDITLTRGKYILTELKKISPTKENINLLLHRVPTIESNPLYSSTFDGWFNEYQISINKDRLFLSSKGSPTNRHELKIGSIQIKN